MSEFVADIFRTQIELKNARFSGCPYVFPGKTGKQRTDCSAVDRIRTQAGLPKTFRPFHGLRHHFAVTFLEDRCRTRFRNKAQSLASFRNLAITLIRQGKFECIPEGLEYYAENRDRAIDAVMKQRTE